MVGVNYNKNNVGWLIKWNGNMLFQCMYLVLGVLHVWSIMYVLGTRSISNHLYVLSGTMIITGADPGVF